MATVKARVANEEARARANEEVKVRAVGEAMQTFVEHMYYVERAALRISSKLRAC